MKAFAPVDLPQVTTPPAPTAGRQSLYPKSDGRWYTENANGVETPLGSGGYPPYSAEIFPNVGNISNNTIANVGSTITFTSMGTDDVFLVAYAMSVNVPASTINYWTLAIDGAAWDDSKRTYLGAGYTTGTRVHNVTGLAAGTHTVGLRSWNNVTATTTVYNNSTLTIVRITGSGTDTVEAITLAIPSNWAPPTSVYSKMPFTTKVHQVGAINVDASGNIVINRAGTYHVAASLEYMGGGGYVETRLRQWRGGGFIRDLSTVESGGSYGAMSLVGTFDCQVGDLFEVVANAQTTGVSMENVRQVFTAHRIAAGGTQYDSGWITPTLLNGWANYGGGFSTAGYRKVNGIVYLKGLIRNGTVGTTMFTLPAGFRPIETALMAISMGEPSQYARIDVQNNGNVNSVSNSNTWQSLDTIRFPADL